MARVLLAAPVRQEPDILRLALAGWDEAARRSGADVRAVLVDDNTDPASSAVLEAFARQASGMAVTVHRAADGLPDSGTYARAADTHVWDAGSIGRVAAVKDALIRLALDDPSTTHLFLVDSDLVLHPDTLGTLLAHEVEVVAEVFWTRFRPEMPLMPNCWDTHPTRYDSAASVTRLREPGLHAVGGTGACTMIARSALKRGLRFASVPHLDLWGEDRHLSVRAAVLGIDLHVDTTHPAFHVYRADDLDAARRWAAEGCPRAAWTDRLDEAWASEVTELVHRQQTGSLPARIRRRVGETRATLRRAPLARWVLRGSAR